MGRAEKPPILKNRWLRGVLIALASILFALFLVRLFVITWMNADVEATRNLRNTFQEAPK